MRFVIVCAEIAHLLSEHASAGSKHEPNKNRTSRTRGPTGRQELIGDVNIRVPGITFARLFLHGGISDRESMRPEVVQPVASAGDRIFKLDRGDSFKPISTVAYRKKFSSRSDSPLECRHVGKNGVIAKILVLETGNKYLEPKIEIILIRLFFVA